MKFGDICNVLAMLHKEFLATGQPQILVTTKGLLPLLDGVSYIQPEIYKGDWQDLKGALLWAKRKFENVKCLSFHGKNWPVHKKTCSFQLDLYERGGLLEGQHRFKFPELVFDKRSPEREAALVAQHTKDCQPFILVADHSESSPFDQIEGLVSLLEEQFGVYHQIIRLSTVKAEKPYDLLGLYDKAVALVSIDTMHLHLSMASPVPVVALISDKPEFWHGTAWQSRFKAHVRYGDYADRQDVIIKTLQGIIDKVEPIKPVIYDTVHAYGYNPSIIEFEGRLLTSYRYHPNRLFWRTQLAIRDGEQIFPIKAPKGFEEHSLEDGRLFIHKDKLHISYVVACAPNNVFQCVIQYGELVKDEHGWSIQNNFQPDYGRNDFSGTEKNWNPFSYEGKLHFTYQAAPEHLVLEVERDIITNEYRTVTPTCPFGQPRGGTQPITYGDGRWLRLFHVQENKHNDRTRFKYHVGALVMESKPPFQIKKISQKPVYSGNEQYFPNWKFFKWNVAIPYGAVKQDDGYMVSIGVNDSACAGLFVTDKDLNL